jgi:hypothetical protein
LLREGNSGDAILQGVFSSHWRLGERYAGVVGRRTSVGIKIARPGS